MAGSKDILLTTDYDLEIRKGDFNVGDSDEQHIDLIMLSHKGHWRNSPLTGIGVASHLNSSGSLQSLKQRIDLQLQYDGYEKVSVEIKDGEISIDAKKE